MPKRMCHAAVKYVLLDVFREFDGVVFAHFVVVRLALHGDAFVGSQFLLDFREQFSFESGILLDGLSRNANSISCIPKAFPVQAP